MKRPFKYTHTTRARHYNTTSSCWTVKNKRLNRKEPFIHQEKLFYYRTAFSTTRTKAQDLVLDSGRVLADFYHVTDSTFIVLVMYVQFSRTTDEFTIQRVFHHTFDSNNNRFLHFVANYTTLQSTDFISSLRTCLLS